MAFPRRNVALEIRKVFLLILQRFFRALYGQAQPPASLVRQGTVLPFAGHAPHGHTLNSWTDRPKMESGTFHASLLFGPSRFIGESDLANNSVSQLASDAYTIAYKWLSSGRCRCAALSLSLLAPFFSLFCLLLPRFAFSPVVRPHVRRSHFEYDDA